MEKINLFINYLSRFVPISEDEFNRVLSSRIIIRRFGRKEMLLRAGEVENYFNFILSGLIRKYYLKGKEEINTQISVEGHIIHCQESFHSRKASEYYVETIEPSVVVSMSYADMEALYSSSQKMEHLGRLVITSTMILKDKWQMKLVKMTPRERFLEFITSHPELMQRVPQKFLASYLHIKPETFSRFKHLTRQLAKIDSDI
ncbi:MAG: Crp/Fnr family transcriptional regulator [Chitinophagaceae bacterium]|nr:Crp/Fnr family transcriptional regulator [Chitinophagaceae bacterium]MBK8952530.1 Crp/Fnr family transcriptional regulator [Chitinophagaceae bacterium]